MANIIHIEKESILNGVGNRCVVWFAGCGHHCPSCHNPETWDPNMGTPFGLKHLKELDSILSNPYIKGVTLSGGDPLYPANRNDVTALACYLKVNYPNKDIWLYTGYSWEEVKDLDIMKYVDVVVDGKFVLALADVKYPWAGSTNQRVIDVKASLKLNKVIEVKS